MSSQLLRLIIVSFYLVPGSPLAIPNNQVHNDSVRKALIKDFFVLLNNFSVDLDLQIPEFGTEPLCNDDPLCDHTKSYPGDYIHHLLKATNINSSIVKSYEMVVGLDERYPKQPKDELSLCSVQPMKMSPRAAKNIKGEWVYIINQHPVRQIFKYEDCYGGKAGNYIMLHENETSFCVQKQVYVNLFSLNRKGEIKLDDFHFPGYCERQIWNNLADR